MSPDPTLRTGGTAHTSGTASPGSAAGATGVARRKTNQQAVIAAELKGLKEFISVRELHRLLSDAGHRIGVATVYRQLNRLAEDGEVDSIDGPEGDRLFRACGSTEHHHHIVCRSCGRTVEISPPIEKWLAEVGESNGFTEITHTLEAFGTCADCARKAQ